MATKDKAQDLPVADDMTEVPEDGATPAAAKEVYYNLSQNVSPRHHQPAEPAEADRVNKDAAKSVVKTSDVASTSPLEVPDPKEASMKAGDANKQASELNAEGK